MTRGLRNNNPGNIRLSKVKYLGEVASTDASFKQFESMAMGYRAMFALLDSYIRRGFNTLEKIINRYAPPQENDTNNYLRFVCRETSLDKDRVLSMSDKDEIKAVVSAMSYMENGLRANAEQVDAGFSKWLK